jgi:bifunctional non-homologous end joining protein LigD
MAIHCRRSGSPDPPRFIPPQLTKPVDAAPAGAGWLHEIKFDGYRMHARVADKQAKLLTRTGWTGPRSTGASPRRW